MVNGQRYHFALKILSSVQASRPARARHHKVDRALVDYRLADGPRPHLWGDILRRARSARAERGRVALSCRTGYEVKRELSFGIFRNPRVRRAIAVGTT